MRARETTALVLLPLILAGIVWLPPWVYLLAVALAALAAAWELIDLFQTKGVPLFIWPTLGATAVGILVGLQRSPSALALFFAASTLIVPLIYLLSRGPLEGSSGAISASLFVTNYFTVTATAMGLLRLAFPSPLGWKLVLLHCLTIWGGDSGAYYVGVKWGRHMLAPRISPKKSWEGVVGGTALTFFGVWFCKTVFFGELPWLLALAEGALLAVLAPLGDLLESLFKRDAGVKDSSDFIPGHGGFLDRTDSLFFAAPFTLALMILGLPR